MLDQRTAYTSVFQGFRLFGFQKLVTVFSEYFNEFGFKLLVGVPCTARYRTVRFQVVEHVNDFPAGGHGLDGLNRLLRFQRFEDLLQAWQPQVGFDAYIPDPYALAAGVSDQIEDDQFLGVGVPGRGRGRALILVPERVLYLVKRDDVGRDQLVDYVNAFVDRQHWTGLDEIVVGHTFVTGSLDDLEDTLLGRFQLSATAGFLGKRSGDVSKDVLVSTFDGRHCRSTGEANKTSSGTSRTRGQSVYNAFGHE